MNGELLYALYVAAFAEQDTDVEPWTTLDEPDKEAWERIAELLREKM